MCKQIFQKRRIITKDQTETGYFYDASCHPISNRCVFDLRKSFRPLKNLLKGDVWFVIKYLLMLFRQHILIPNYFHVGLGCCNANVSSEKKFLYVFAKMGFCAGILGNNLLKLFDF